MENLSARDLLELTVEYLERWKDISNADKEPASYRRLQQIDAFISAFFEDEIANPNQSLEYFDCKTGTNYSRKTLLEKTSKLDYFIKGEFLNDRKDEENNRELIEKVLRERRFLLEKAPVEAGREISKIRFSRLFSFLFSEYRRFYPIANWGGIVTLESSDYDYYYAQKFRARIRSDIQATFAELEKDLCLLIDPKSRVFSREILIKNYGFPDVDLRKPDEEYNYF